MTARKHRFYPDNTIACWRLVLTTERASFSYTVIIDIAKGGFMMAWLEEHIPESAKELAYRRVYEKMASYELGKGVLCYTMEKRWQYVGGDEYMSQMHQDDHSTIIVH